MTRIIAGSAGGLRLETPRGSGTRPTSDRVREALFSAIESRWDLDGARFLDLYAGSGALGLEAWSRGAEAVTLVESDRRAADLITANAATIGCRDAEVLHRPVAAVLAAAAPRAYDVVVADPPYAVDEAVLAEDLASLATHDWLAPEALVVVERSARSPAPTWPPGLVPLRGKRGHRRYGETALWFAEWHPEVH
ncbi:16S rRNA (guanine(966)-N(2))-methyltransferase RsmD [Nocardioides panacisoli]|uniref:16S rRNA (guanine(966)-N(2))-methyltransferase RsmD n=1 Tax=Nocardioides panacisoli TaxID=627624 RepID=UPI001C62B57C|nr:16S rRNA (guanine(966)-N(2))-methyltransferase RsmD [Nocardioides panacisoli]QYJ04555.1 16S rRNA (guanine(966)-N(2))-methyltransferase RsmD [Nocardioides panacisoli]